MKLARSAAALVLAALLGLTAAACNGGVGSTSSPASTVLSATGLIVAANGPDAATVNTFSLRTDDGLTLDFAVGTLDVSGGGLPAPHLREHMAGSTRTTVYYVVQDGRNVAVKYTDADE